MDFIFTTAQESLRNTACSFARSEIAPRAIEMDETGEIPRDLIKRMGELGMIGTIIPKEYGGSATGHVARMIVIEELSRVYASLGFFLETPHMGIFVLQTHGNEKQKAEYLPSLSTGEKISVLAVTEQGGGSAPANIQTSATLDKDIFIVNGKKTFISWGGIAEICILLTNTEKGPTILLIDKNVSGYTVGEERIRTSGLRSVGAAELLFSNCRVPPENIIGEEGRGLAYALESIQDIGRTGAAGTALGIARGAYESALNFAKGRVLYGNPIAKLQSIQFKLADMDIKVEAARWLVYYAAWLLDQGKSGKDTALPVSRAKVFAVESARDIALKAIEIHGGSGTLPEYHVIRHLRDSLELFSAAGTNDIMRVVIGGTIIK